MINYNNIKSVIGTNKRIVWLYNIGVEDFWHGNVFSVKDKSGMKIVNEMEDMNLLIASMNDIVIMRNKPSYEYLSYLKNIGFNIPTILKVCGDDDTKNISELVLEDQGLLYTLSNLSDDYVLCPYGISEIEEKISEITGLKLIGGTSKLARLVNDKIFAREVSQNLGFKTTEGKKCKFDDIETEINYLFEVKKYKKAIVKVPCGASGKGLYIIDGKESIKRTLLILKRFHSNEEYFLVEGWIDNKKDYNYQLYVGEDSTKVFSIKEQILDKTIYTGSLFQIDNNIETEILDKGKQIGEYLRKKFNYNGFLGIDCLTDNGELVPILEINGRFTLSTYLSFLSAVFGNKFFYSFYKNVSNLTYNEVVKKLESSKIQYNREIGSGAICYVEGSLQEKGRLFILVIANSDNEIKEIYNKVIQVLNIGE